MQVHDGAGAGAFLVNGAVQKSFLGRWIAGEMIAFIVQLGDVPRVQPAETTVGRRQ